MTCHSFAAPTKPWSGRIWARTGCTHTNGKFQCAPGDFTNRIKCNGLEHFSLHRCHNDPSSYGVSFVDGFNVPTPRYSKGPCRIMGCRANQLATCPKNLQACHPPGHGAVLGCGGGCRAFGKDEVCCRNHCDSSQTCKASNFSKFFKHACPATFTYAHGGPPFMHACSSPHKHKGIFCHQTHAP